MMGSGSDHTVFIHNLGVPAIGMTYTYEEVYQNKLICTSLSISY